MRIRWLRRCDEDIEAAFDWLAERNLDAAWELLARLRKRALSDLAAYPEIGRSGRVSGTRELVVPGTSYLLVYRIRPEEIQILRVLHGRQQWPPRIGT